MVVDHDLDVLPPGTRVAMHPVLEDPLPTCQKRPIVDVEATEDLADRRRRPAHGRAGRLRPGLVDRPIPLLESVPTTGTRWSGGASPWRPPPPRRSAPTA